MLTLNLLVAYEAHQGLLFISYKFVKGILAITFFYYFLFLAETFTMCVNVFYITRNEISP